MKERIAIIGGGIGGLMAAYLLHERHEVTLLEKAQRLGGNAYTHRLPTGDDVDIAVAAFGMAGYPNFYKLLAELGVRTSWRVQSYMSMQNLRTGEGFYMTPLSLRALWRQRFAMFRKDHVKSIVKMSLGLREGRRRLEDGRLRGQSLEQALDAIPELSGETRLLLLCALCLMSSMSGREVLDAPAEFFFEKLAIHRDVVSPKASYSVRCVNGTTKDYVSAIAAKLSGHVELGAKVARVERHEGRVTLVMQGGERRAFDKVIFACHADQALRLLAEPTALERELLGAWKYKEGRVVVHRDLSAFPPRELMQAYTFLYTLDGGVFDTSVTGSLWHEPKVSKDCEYVSSQHPNYPIDPERIDLDTMLRTPIFDDASVPTIRRLGELNGLQNSYYCGSYFGHGLHEDAVRSAIEVARRLGGRWDRG